MRYFLACFSVLALCLGVGLRFGVGFWGFEIGMFWFLPLRIVLSTGQVWFLSVAARFPYLNSSADKTNVNRLLSVIFFLCSIMVPNIQVQP